MSRLEENKQEDLCKNPKETNQSQYVGTLLTKTIQKHHNIYVMTDWHFWIRNAKGQTKCHKRENFNEIINNIKNVITKDDVLVYLGDIVDGEFNNQEELKTLLIALPGEKVLVRGNNDLFSYQYYRSCGFKYIVRSFVWRDILFSHYPVENDNQYNVHGHIHGYKTYWIPYTNQIDVAYCDGRITPVKLMDVINKQPAYSKLIKVQPEHFGESYDIFESIMEDIIYERQ